MTIRPRWRFLSFLIIFSLVFPPHLAPPAYAAQVALPEATPVVLRLTETVAPTTHHVGDVVHLEVAMDVTVDGATVIKAGTPAEGEVVISEKAAWLGEAGKLGITLRSTKAVDGQRIPLRANLTREGKEKQGLAVVLGILLCFLFLFMKGETVQFTAGSEVKGYVESGLKVSA